MMLTINNNKLKTNQKQNTKIKFLIVICFFFVEIITYGQCAMCRASLEGEENTEKAKSVNSGIVYLMSFPYILAAIMGYVIYRMYVKKRKTQS
jgi:hypothetical protein